MNLKVVHLHTIKTHGGDLHGSHQGVFITKQTTFIQPNTTQVYFKWLPLQVRLIRFLYQLME